MEASSAQLPAPRGRRQWAVVPPVGVIWVYRPSHRSDIGGGDAATEEALFLAPLARRVIVIHPRRRMRASTAMVTQLRAKPNVVVLDCRSLRALTPVLE
jgi:hypothetical protein